MYKVILKDTFIESVSVFIRSYSEIFEKLYSDTWIANEDIIVENYRQAWREFKNQVFQEVDRIFSQEFVLGRKINSDKTLSFILNEMKFCFYNRLYRRYRLPNSLYREYFIY